jgi:HlyD family secretion protein
MQAKPKKTWILAAAGGLLLVALLAWAFAPRPVAVETAAATLGPFETTLDEDGRTRLRERFTVSAPLAGRLARITLHEGDRVTAGQAVAELTPVLAPMLDARTLAELGARAEAAQANAGRAATRTGAARIALEQARNELRRTEQLVQQGFVAPAKVEGDRLAVQAAQKELETAQAGERVAAQELQQARAAIGTVQGTSTRGFAVRAPVAGQVLRVLQASEGVVALGTPLIEIGDLAQLEVVAELLTTDALQARPGTPVRIERWGGPGVLEGRVRLVEPAAFTKVSALGVEEQRVKVLIELTSPREQWRALGDGFRVAVRIVTRSEAQALTVPLAAVFPRPEAEGGGHAVFVLDGGRAKLQPVQVLARNSAQALIGPGLPAGTEVLVYPPAAVADGVRVKARKV